jgi:catechol 2,3-dioxygenase-like lactoylglutathione lyase family enzyme
MTTPNPNYPIPELRVTMTSQDYARLVKFYCEGLGVQPAEDYSDEVGKALLLNMGRATRELIDEPQAESIDRIEAGERVSGKIRFAIKVPDLQAAMDKMLAHGATLVHQPVITPWGDHNVRLQDPEGMQITLFEEKPK